MRRRFGAGIKALSVVGCSPDRPVRAVRFQAADPADEPAVGAMDIVLRPRLNLIRLSNAELRVQDGSGEAGSGKA